MDDGADENVRAILIEFDTDTKATLTGWMPVDEDNRANHEADGLASDPTPSKESSARASLFRSSGAWWARVSVLMNCLGKVPVLLF